MLTKYLDPKNDYAFKRLFGRPKSQDILIYDELNTYEQEEKRELDDNSIRELILDTGRAEGRAEISKKND